MENTNTKALQVIEKDISDTVLNRVKELENNQQLILPENYNVGNALKSAYLKLVESDLLNCDKNSIAQSLLDMSIQGLTPAKNQCYFIKYGNRVSMSRSYFGDVTVAKHTKLIKDVYAICIYKDDIIEIGFDNEGRRIVSKHETKFENIDKEIIGAYAVANYHDDRKIYEVMTIAEIKKSWKMSNTIKVGKEAVLHRDYTQEACKRTVIRRLVKMIFNTSVDNNVVADSYTRTTEEEAKIRENVIDAETSLANAEIKEQVIVENVGKKSLETEIKEVETNDVEVEEMFEKVEEKRFDFE